MIPHDFVLDLLYPLPAYTKRLFGTSAIYIGDKVVLATRQKEEIPQDNGIWVCTKVVHHQALKELFPSLRNLKTFKIKSWLVLPESADDFEETAEKVVTLIKHNSNLIGSIPAKRKPKKGKGK